MTDERMFDDQDTFNKSDGVRLTGALSMLRPIWG